MSLEIIQIVSRLPPAIDGVGDYAWLLARKLRASHDIHTTFVVCNPNWGKSEIGNRKLKIELDGFPVHQLKQRSAGELLRALSAPGMPSTVLLQYVGYGYEKRGCPVWLTRALRAWKMEGAEQLPSSNLRPPASGRSLVTMFHELYAFGPPWRSSFWTSPVQKWIAKTLACSSEHCLTNLNLNARTLQRLTSREENGFTVLPVLSNVGEPEHLPDWNERKSRMVVFGGIARRQKVYFEHKADLEIACRAMNLNEIVDIGPALKKMPSLSIRCVQRGLLPSEEVSREMLSARAGFFALPPAYLGKSGIFAAYTAHGLAPVTCHANQTNNDDGLSLGKHFVSANELSRYNWGEIKKIAKAASEWYCHHNLHNQGASYAKVLPFCTASKQA